MLRTLAAGAQKCASSAAFLVGCALSKGSPPMRGIALALMRRDAR